MSISVDSTNGDRINDHQQEPEELLQLRARVAELELRRTEMHFREKFPKLEVELKDVKQMSIITKYVMENRLLQAELKHQKLLTEHNALMVKVAEMEKEQQKMADHLTHKQNEQKELWVKVDELEQKQTADSEQLNKSQEGILAKIDQLAQQVKDSELFKQAFPSKFAAMENFVGVLKDRFGNDLLKAVHPNIRTKIAEVFSNPPQNCWDVNACHSDLVIFGPECLMVHYKSEGDVWRAVFSKCSIPNSHFRIFYYEVKIVNVKRCISVGLAAKEMPTEKMVGNCAGTYSYTGDGIFWINGSKNEGKQTFVRDDTVGCGVNLATGRIIFTKNGQRLDTANLFVSSPDSLFPCVSLCDSGDLIDANFGPNFKFNPSAV
ncbi:hypothetical protein niasHT_032363 [Heterodera trifolii]|uniref:B30.2/SPRY domain-containing protein n=1 Tax=Heterodera trifolii TaxID=157864 RepID=A0ABD2HVX3_9BILA